MRRFFYEPARQDVANRIVIVDAEAHHLRTVLRMRIGDVAELFDGTGSIARGQIEQISSGRIVFRVLSRNMEPAFGVQLTLVLAMLKGQKMDLAVQKATELGVHVFVPAVSRCCERQTGSDQLLQRWRRIMLEACKQCRRPIPMQIMPPVSLEQLVLPTSSHKIMPWEKEADVAFPWRGLKDGRSIVLLVGPEGGFEPEEVVFAKNAGFMTVSLGPRILRAETAALTAVVLAQHAAGNWDAFPEKQVGNLNEADSTLLHEKKS